MSETCRVIINQVKQKLHLVGYLLIRYFKDARYHEHNILYMPLLSIIHAKVLLYEFETWSFAVSGEPRLRELHRISGYNGHRQSEDGAENCTMGSFTVYSCYETLSE